MSDPLSEVYPLLYSSDVARISDWAVASLGLKESWRANDDDGQVRNAELHWPGGRISISRQKPSSTKMGPAGIALRVDDPDAVQATYELAASAGTEVIQGPEESRISFSFTALDPDGNQWWVNAENGFLDKLRNR